MATPHVAGVAALVRALRPGDAATAVRQAILAGAERRPGLDGYAVTGARLNAAGALDAAAGGPGAPAPEPAPEPVLGIQPPAPAPSVTPAPAPAPAIPAPGTPPGTPATVRDPVSRPASPFASLRVAVRRRAVTVRLGLSRRATVRLTLHRGRAVSARSRLLAAGTSTVALGRLPRGTYRLRASAGADAIERRFTVR
jgi:subtilisin family serine protease